MSNKKLIKKTKTLPVFTINVNKAYTPPNKEFKDGWFENLHTENRKQEFKLKNL